MQRKTKIIATLGPTSQTPQSIGKILKNGADLVRINYSHGTHEEHEKKVKIVRNWSKKNKREIGIIADLQGPKVRITSFANPPIKLKKGHNFTIDPNFKGLGNENIVGINYKKLAKEVKKGDRLLLDDGLIALKIISIKQGKIHCLILNNGILTNKKGLNKLGGGLSIGSLTKKDHTDLQQALSLDVDFIAVSFVKSATDINKVRKLIFSHKANCRVIAKIERKEAIDNLDEIIKASDGLLVARGDLAIEVGVEEVPALQKYIIKESVRLNKAVITATQMMESMRKHRIPTRAEVSDVANAILDGTDAIMLSAETATGIHPDLVIETADVICKSVEQQPMAYNDRIEDKSVTQIDEAIAMSSMFIANNLPIKAIIALTESGSTVLWMSRVHSHIPIYGLSRNIKTLRILNLYRNVYAMPFDPTKVDQKNFTKKLIDTLKKRKFVFTNDRIIITKGDIVGKTGQTNSLKIEIV